MVKKGKCSIASLPRPRERDLRKAEIISRKKIGVNPKCETCGCTFSRKAGLKRHKCYKKLKIHNVLFSLYSCHECKVAYPTKCQLAAHMKGHLSYQEQKFDTDIAPSHDYALRHSLEDSCKQSHVMYKCQECSLSFRCQTSLIAHMTVHNDNSSSHQCVKCTLTFVGLKSFKDHVKMHKPLKCTVCGGLFDRQDSLKNHMSTAHHISILHA